MELAARLYRKLRQRLGTSESDFKAVCRMAGLNLDFSYNRSAVAVLLDIFVNRAYSDYFPFYEKSVVVDVGAHFGYFTLFAAKNSAPDSTIIAIEPAAENYQVLCRNIASCGLSNVTALNAALSEVQGTRELFLGGGVNYSLFSKGDNALSANQSQKVDAITLSGLLEKYYLPRIDFLKMDCEGAEYPVLFNVDADVLKRIGTISMEFHDLKKPEFAANRLAAHLERCGFKIVKFSYSPTRLNLNYGKLVATRGFVRAQ